MKNPFKKEVVAKAAPKKKVEVTEVAAPTIDAQVPEKKQREFR